MANRECYPASLFPLRGDLSAEAGAVAATVIGIQNVPVDAPVSPTDDGKVATYVDADKRIEWLVGGGGGSAYFKVNSTSVSEDGLFFINGTMTLGSTPLFGLLVNGTRIP